MLGREIWHGGTNSRNRIKVRNHEDLGEHTREYKIIVTP